METEESLFYSQKQSHLDENEVEYKLIISKSEETVSDTFFKDIQSTLKSLTKNYIWNHEEFSLSDPTQVTSSLSICTGTVDFSSNIDDEWFIVYIMFELSKKFAFKIAIQLNDSDGEFLLIQAADFLPEWASSASNNSTLNRVFVFNGELHLIPPAETPSQVTYNPAFGPIASPVDAFQTLTDFSLITKASDSIQKCIQKRIEPFGSYERNFLHRKTCVIPSNLAWLIENAQKEAYLSAAINRLCDKDPLDLKLCRNFDTFKAQDLMQYRVTFTKHLYSKLQCCDYKPLKAHNWPQIPPNPLESEQLLLGFKLTSAFEILVKVEEKNRDKNNVENSAAFKKFVENLTCKGFFQGNLEHSQKYNELFLQAKENYMKTELKERSLRREMVKDYLSELNETSLKEFKEAGKVILSNVSDDLDDWMNVDEKDLDEFIQRYSRGDVSSTYDFNLLTSAFKKFLDKPKEKMDLLMGSDYAEINKNEEQIDFDLDKLRKTFDEVKMGSGEKKDDGDESDESDSFYQVGDESDDDGNEQEKIGEVMSAMDAELHAEKNLARIKQGGDDVAIDLNLVSNAIESYSSQLGLSGPVSNILKSLGF